MGKGTPRGCCSSCNEKTRTSVHYPFLGFPERFLKLPYFERMKSLSSKSRVCIKCVTTLDFAKKLAKLIERSILVTCTPAASSPPSRETLSKVLPPSASPPIPKLRLAIPKSSPSVVAPPPPPPLPVPRPPPMVVMPPDTDTESEETLTVEELEVAVAPIPIPVTPTTDAHPQTAMPAIPPLRLSLPPKESPPNGVKLPKGLTWDQLTCYVQLNKMRVPPIRIKDLRLQSILKSNSPDKGAKRVSFDNTAPKVFQFRGTARLDTSGTTAVEGDAISSSSEDDDQPSIEITAEKRVEPRTKSDSLPIAKKRPRRASTIVVSYAETGFPALDAEPRLSGSLSPEKQPQTKRFKVYRPKEKEKVARRHSLPLKQLPSSGGPLPQSYSLHKASPPKAIAVAPSTNNALQNGGDGGNKPITAKIKSKQELAQRRLRRKLFALKSQRIEREITEQRTIEPLAHPVPKVRSPPIPSARSPLRRTVARRMSVDMQGGGEDVVFIGTAAASVGPNVAGKISNRRKTIDPAQCSNQQFRLRVVSFEKLKAPTPQVDLLLTGVGAHPVLPRPYQFPSP